MCHLKMGQGYWIKESDGVYKHYTEEEFMNSPRGKAQKWAIITFGILAAFVVLSIAVTIIISIVVGIWQ